MVERLHRAVGAITTGLHTALEGLQVINREVALLLIRDNEGRTESDITAERQEADTSNESD
jgi:hypothetical protein